MGLEVTYTVNEARTVALCTLTSNGTFAQNEFSKPFYIDEGKLVAAMYNGNYLVSSMTDYINGEQALLSIDTTSGKMNYNLVLKPQFGFAAMFSSSDFGLIGLGWFIGDPFVSLAKIDPLGNAVALFKDLVLPDFFYGLLVNSLACGLNYAGNKICLFVGVYHDVTNGVVQCNLNTMESTNFNISGMASALAVSNGNSYLIMNGDGNSMDLFDVTNGMNHIASLPPLSCGNVNQGILYVTDSYAFFLNNFKNTQNQCQQELVKISLLNAKMVSFELPFSSKSVISIFQPISGYNILQAWKSKKYSTADTQSLTKSCENRCIQRKSI